MKHSGPPYLIVISAASGTGKTTLCKRLLDGHSRLVLSISCTTRGPRGSEKHGTEYYFLTRDHFEEQIKNGMFAEWAKVHENYYGTSKQTLEESFKNGNSVLLDIDVQGANQLFASYPDKCIRIFIMPPSLGELEKRLRGRGTDSEETIQKRMKNAKQEIEVGQTFENVIVNDDLDRAYQELKSLLEKKYQFL